MITKTIFPIPFADVVDTESLGTKPKFWVRRPGDSERWLFKEEHRGTGEDWAEVIVADLCNVLEIPHARYEFALAENVTGYDLRGVITRNLATDGWELLHGNTLLGSQDPEYPDGKYRVSEHTLAAVCEVVGGLDSPREAPEAIRATGASGAYAGYLFLDALVGNQDRHHENWGALVKGTNRHLAPTFDHGASLARNISDEERAERVATRDIGRSVSHFARSARSALYRGVGDSQALRTHTAFFEFARLGRVDPAFWVQRLERLDDSSISSILEKIPEERLSPVARHFVFELLRANRKILRDYDA